MKHWTKPQFVRAIREGKKRNGSRLDEMMPWRAIRHLTNEELDALWLALTHQPTLNPLNDSSLELRTSTALSKP